MKALTTDILVACGFGPMAAAKFVGPLNKHLAAYKVNTFLRLSHFISQTIHESNGFTSLVENLNYSAEALMQTWPKRFPTVSIANQYARQPEKIANFVYANRLGNGPVSSGDGWRFRGRTPIQATGKDKYVALTKLFGVDYVTHPEYLERPEDGMLATFWYWQSNGLNAKCDTDNPELVTRAINGGIIGLAHRVALLAQAKRALAPLFATDAVPGVV